MVRYENKLRNISQTHKRIKPQEMVIEDESSIFCFRPPKGPKLKIQIEVYNPRVASYLRGTNDQILPKNHISGTDDPHQIYYHNLPHKIAH